MKGSKNGTILTASIMMVVGLAAHPASVGEPAQSAGLNGPPQIKSRSHLCATPCMPRRHINEVATPVLRPSSSMSLYMK